MILKDHVQCYNCYERNLVDRDEDKCPDCGMVGSLLDIQQDIEV